MAICDAETREKWEEQFALEKKFRDMVWQKYKKAGVCSGYDDVFFDTALKAGFHSCWSHIGSGSWFLGKLAARHPELLEKMVDCIKPKKDSSGGNPFYDKECAEGWIEMARLKPAREIIISESAGTQYAWLTSFLGGTGIHNCDGVDGHLNINVHEESIDQRTKCGIFFPIRRIPESADEFDASKYAVRFLDHHAIDYKQYHQFIGGNSLRGFDLYMKVHAGPFDSGSWIPSMKRKYPDSDDERHPDVYES